MIKEANNDAGLAAHPSKRWTMNANWFQIVMLAYNLNCWLLLFHREEAAKLAGTPPWRQRDCGSCFWRPRSGGMPGVGVSYSDHYQECGILNRLMQRLRSITTGASGFTPLIATALRC